MKFEIDTNDKIAKLVKGDNIEKLVIPGTIFVNGETYEVTSIGDCAVAFMDALKYVDIPDTVVTIRNNAFCQNKALMEVVLGRNIKVVGSHTFYGCENLKKVTNRSRLPLEMGNSRHGFISYYADNIITEN